MKALLILLVLTLSACAPTAFTLGDMPQRTTPRGYYVIGGNSNSAYIMPDGRGGYYIIGDKGHSAYIMPDNGGY